MKPIVTMRWLCAAVLGALLLPVGSAQAQEQPTLGEDEFVFFVDGANVLIPNVAPETVNDPLDPTSGNKVAKCTYAGWSFCGFGWQIDEGVDASAFIGDEYGESDTMYLRLLSGPANAGKNVVITFFDKTTHPALSRAELEGGAEGDLEFRAVWQIPEAWHDSTWHEAAIPLPPATLAALDSAKVGKKSDGTALGIQIDELAANWNYTGGWNNGGSYGFGEVGGFTPSSDDPLYEDFEWDAVHTFSIQFDHASGGSVVLLDYLYFSGPEIDLTAASGAPAAMGAITVEATGQSNTVSWTHNPEFGGYNVYASDEPISDVSSAGVVKLGNVPFNADAFQLAHRFEIPHPELDDSPIYYAVTSVSVFGTENPDVTNSTGNVANPDLAQQPFIIQLTSAEADSIFENIENGIVSDDGFPEGYRPFRINNAHSQLGDSPTPSLPEDSDVSGVFKMAYSDFNELYIYADITDDAVQFGIDGVDTGAETWQYDSYEIGWGNYDVVDVDGSILIGSPHVDMVRGALADYQFRISGLQDGTTGDVTATTTFEGPALTAEIQGAATVVEKTDTGWRALTVIPLNAIQDVGDAVIDPPGADEIRYMPMEISINDADGSDREHQITWGLKPNHTSQWWNTPAEWPTVALAGRNTAMPTDTEDAPEVVGATFELSANYPNPFHSSTVMDYALPQADQVYMAVYDILGRQVAVLVDGFKPAGTHQVRFSATGLASGAYLVRLQAGDHVAVQRVTLVK